MKNRILFILIIVLLSSFNQKVYADEFCSPNGYSIFTVNGIFSNESDAIKNRDKLENQFSKTYNGEPLIIDYLYNPSHIAGLGDLTDVINQGLFNQGSDYDLIEILSDASQKVKTQKLLLIAHSQGNFYSNSFYDRVASREGGVPSQSIGVYGVASPADHVAGGGKYLTSDTDSVIASTVGRFINILPPNVHIPIKKNDGNGHSFSDVYLKYQGSRIVSDIKSSLNKLQKNDEKLADEPCITPPELDITHKVAGAMFFVADPVANVTKDIAVGVVVGSYNVATTIGNGILGAARYIALAVSSFSKSTISFVGNIDDRSGATVVIADNQNEETNENTPRDIVLNESENIAKEIPDNKIPTEPIVSENIVEQNTQLTSEIPEAVEVATPTPLPIIFWGGGGGGSYSAPEVIIVDDTPPDIIAPDVPVITTTSQLVNTDDIIITGTAEIDSTITISGGENIVTGIATDGNYSVLVPLNQNVLNTLSVTASDSSDNISDPVEILITHDNIPPVINSLTFYSHTGTLVVGGKLFLTITADASDYTASEITINEVPVDSFIDNANGFYTASHIVTLDEEDRTSGNVPVSVVLTDVAGNSNIAYTTPVPNGFIINAHFPVSPVQVFPTFSSDGKFTEDIVLDCVTDSGYFEMYYIKDSDSTFRMMNIPGGTVLCPDNKRTYVSSGFGFEDFAGYNPVEGWYYGVVSVAYPKCALSQNDTVCVNDNLQSFFRLYRNALGVWSDSDVFLDTTSPIISSISVSPDSGYVKIGDVVTLSITADSAGYTAQTININNVPATDFTDNGDGTYTAIYTISSGDNDVNVGEVSASVVLTDASANSNDAYVEIAINTLKIDANAPAMLSAEVTSLNTIDVTFNEDIKGSTVNTSGNEFTISEPEYVVSEAHELIDGVVTLTLSTNMGAGETPSVTFSSTNFQDLAGNQAISPATVLSTNSL